MNDTTGPILAISSLADVSIHPRINYLPTVDRLEKYQKVDVSSSLGGTVHG